MSFESFVLLDIIAIEEITYFDQIQNAEAVFAVLEILVY